MIIWVLYVPNNRTIFLLQIYVKLERPLKAKRQ